MFCRNLFLRPNKCRPNNDKENSTLTIKAQVPYYDRFVANLEKSGPGEQETVQQILDNFMFGKVAYIEVTGSKVSSPVPIAVKLDNVLKVAEQRREQHIRWLRCMQRRGRARNRVICDAMVFTEDDMKDLMNYWVLDVEAWMLHRNVVEFRALQRKGKNNQAQQFARSRFSTYLFQLIGNKMFVDAIIRVPVTLHDSAEQPIASPVRNIATFLALWKSQVASPEHIAEVEKSRKKIHGHVRESYARYQAQRDYYRGKKILDSILDGTLIWDELSPQNQELAHNYETGIANQTFKHHLDAQLDRGPQRGANSYRGAASSSLHGFL